MMSAMAQCTTMAWARGSRSLAALAVGLVFGVWVFGLWGCEPKEEASSAAASATAAVSTPSGSPPSGSTPSGSTPSGSTSTGSMAAEDGATPSGAGSVAADPSAARDGLRGRWRVARSSGDEGGHVFRNRIGEVVEIQGDTFSLPPDLAAAGTTVRKTLRVVSVEGGVVAVDLVHRGNFMPNASTAQDEAARRSPNSKGWSRHSIARVVDDTMTLALDFPQRPRPTSFTPTGSVEVVVLERQVDR